MLTKMVQHYGEGNNFIITAPTYKILSQSTLPTFLRLASSFGRHDKKNDLFKTQWGGTCFFRTETDPDSIVGIPDTKHIWCDEAGKYRLYFWQNIQARADATGCGIDLTTSPYSMNWIYKEIIKPKRSGLRDDVEFITAPSWENPYHSLYDPQKRRQVESTMDPRRFNMIYGGEWGKMEGLVYDCWDDDENIVSAFDLPIGTKYYGGIDWGYNPDPFALKIRAITLDGRHYGVSEFMKTKQTITDIIQICKQKKEVYGISAFYCDPSQPGYIEELNRNGLIAIPAENDINRGIDLHYDLIKTRRYKEFRGACQFSQDERETYHYPEPDDIGPDESSKEQKPVDQNNHLMDADRYLSLETYRKGEKKIPREADTRTKYKTRLDELKYSYKKAHSEEWS